MPIENLGKNHFTAAEKTQLNDAVDTIMSLIGAKTYNLSPKERSKYGKIGDKKKLLITKTKEYHENTPALQSPDVNWQYMPFTAIFLRLNRPYPGRMKTQARKTGLPSCGSVAHWSHHRTSPAPNRCQPSAATFVCTRVAQASTCPTRPWRLFSGAPVRISCALHRPFTLARIASHAHRTRFAQCPSWRRLNCATLRRTPPCASTWATCRPFTPHLINGQHAALPLCFKAMASHTPCKPCTSAGTGCASSNPCSSPCGSGAWCPACCCACWWVTAPGRSQTPRRARPSHRTSTCPAPTPSWTRCR